MRKEPLFKRQEIRPQETLVNSEEYNMKGLERLEVIQKLSQKNPKWKHTDLFRLLRKEDIWIIAYENIKSNKGALTPGIPADTMDGTNLTQLRKLRDSILDESYQFTPVRQTWIPKPDGQKRPLSIPKPNDKIVQEVIRMVLSAIYVPNFDKRSFGFRKGMGVHDALEYVEDNFRWVDWVIEGDIKQAYPTIDHQKLCEILSYRIEDVQFLKLIRKSLKGGTRENLKTLYSKLGVPQGSIVSPMLANIYFNELDTWVQTKEKMLYEKKSSKRNPGYRKFEYQIKKLTILLDKENRNSKQHKKIVKEIKALIQQRNAVPSLLDKGVEIKYTRYADDWIIGVKGNRKLAEQLKEEVGAFLKRSLKQEIHPIKTKITHLRTGKVSFLGYHIFLPRNMKINKYKGEGRQTTRRSPPTLSFQLPVEMVIKRLKDRGYLAYHNYKIRPISKASYTPLEDAVIVNHFKSVWLGIANFYSGCTHRSHLQYIHYLLHMSCAMSLAHRHRSSSSKIFKKYGKKLEIKEKKDPTKVCAFFPYQTHWRYGDRKWLTAKFLKDPFTI